MKNFILIEPTNVKIIYARNLLLTLCTAVKLQLKGWTSLLKYSVKNLIWNHPHESQRFGFSAREDKGDREGILHTYPIP